MSTGSDHTPSTDGSLGCLTVVDRRPWDSQVTQRLEACSRCLKSYDGPAHISFAFVGDDGLFIENLKAPFPKSGWGSALVRGLQSLYPCRTKWTAKQINDSGDAFWRRMSEKGIVTIEIVAEPKD